MRRFDKWRPALRFFEVSREHAMQVLDSVGAESDHSPERHAVFAAMKGGRAKLINTLVTVSRSGVRSEIVDAEESQYPVEIDVPDKNQSVGAVLLESRKVGTLLKVDA